MWPNGLFSFGTKGLAGLGTLDAGPLKLKVGVDTVTLLPKTLLFGRGGGGMAVVAGLLGMGEKSGFIVDVG